MIFIAQDKHYIAFITEDKIGMTALPLDGNPHNTTALLAHCDGASNMVVCPQSRYLFTVGGKVSYLRKHSIFISIIQ